MIMGVQASHKFEDYNIFLRAMHTALFEIKDDAELYIYSAGPGKLNNMAIEFANITERSLKAKGIKIQVRRVPPSWFREYMSDIDFFAYFCKPGEGVSDLVDLAESNGKVPYIYRYS